MGRRHLVHDDTRKVTDVFIESTWNTATRYVCSIPDWVLSYFPADRKYVIRAILRLPPVILESQIQWWAGAGKYDPNTEQGQKDRDAWRQRQGRRGVR